MKTQNLVGPVLESGPVASAIITALLKGNPELRVYDRGAYLRALAPVRCTLRREEVERIIGCSFSLPRDLELVMPSFSGQIHIDTDEVRWESKTA